MTHYQYKGNSVLKLSSTVFHDVWNYFQYLWKPVLILAVCCFLLYKSITWCIVYAINLGVEVQSQKEKQYPIASVKERVEPIQDKNEIKKEKKK